MKNIEVVKMNGEKENYREDKVIRSLKKSGADDGAVGEIINELNKILYNGIETRKIFRFVFKELKKREGTFGARYNIKQGLMEMSLRGGYVFEKFMGRVFQKLGYAVKLNQFIQGRHIEHEIDIAGEKAGEKIMVECKYFSRDSSGISIQTALYVYARFLDVNESFNGAFLVTNTKFSPQVIKYSKGVGLNLIGWSYPVKNGLEFLIEKFKIFPVAILPLKKNELRTYLENDILTFEDLLKEPGVKAKIRKIAEKMMK